MNKDIQGDFQICISVPLIQLEEHYLACNELKEGSALTYYWKLETFKIIRKFLFLKATYRKFLEQFQRHCCLVLTFL